MLSLKFKNAYINDYFGIIGPNHNLDIKDIDYKMNDYYFGMKTFEQAQIRMESEVINNLLKKHKDIDLIIGGDLSNQLTSTYYGINNVKKEISTIGVYSACASFVEGLIIASLFLNNKKNLKIINITSSHSLASERQFRFPVEYGTIRNVNSTLTATGAVGCIISGFESNIKIIDATIGYPTERGINDPNYMGAVMAPSAEEVIVNHLKNHHYKIDDFDIILTGDLGKVGVEILKKCLERNHGINAENICDGGANLYKRNREINNGASGPAVLPLYLLYNILKEKKYKRILVVGTGALHSKNLVNQKSVIPSISHALTIEVNLWAYYGLLLYRDYFA